MVWQTVVVDKIGITFLVSFENVVETHNSLIIVLSSNKLSNKLSQHFITTGSVVILIMQSAHATRLLM